MGGGYHWCGSNSTYATTQFWLKPDIVNWWKWNPIISLNEMLILTRTLPGPMQPCILVQFYQTRKAVKVSDFLISSESWQCLLKLQVIWLISRTSVFLASFSQSQTFQGFCVLLSPSRPYICLSNTGQGGVTRGKKTQKSLDIVDIVALCDIKTHWKAVW